MALRKVDKIFSNYCTASLVLPSESDLYFDLLQRFVVLMYPPSGIAEGVNDARCILYIQYDRTIENIPYMSDLLPSPQSFKESNSAMQCMDTLPRTIWTATGSMFMGLEKMWIRIRTSVVFQPWWREIGKIIEVDCL